MERKIINPWRWQDSLGFVQANDVSGHRRLVICAGRTSNDADGNPMHEGDMRARMSLVLDNVETILGQAALGLSNVVQIRYYTLDVDRFFGAYDAVTDRPEAAGCRPAATLLGVERLAFPELLVEIEATAVA